MFYVSMFRATSRFEKRSTFVLSFQRSSSDISPLFWQKIDVDDPEIYQEKSFHYFAYISLNLEDLGAGELVCLNCHEVSYFPGCNGVPKFHHESLSLQYGDLSFPDSTVVHLHLSSISSVILLVNPVPYC
jgi:hypothetical protein